MPVLILFVLALVLGLWAIKIIAKVNPELGKRLEKAGGGLLALGLAVYLGLQGELSVALPLGAFGLGLLGWMSFGAVGFPKRTKKSRGQTSRVRSAMLDMQLDHDSGRMRGRFTGGTYSGRDLDAIDVASLAKLLPTLDEESRALLLAYLDRRDPAWGEHAQGDAASRRAAAFGGKMTEEEAYQILGVQPGASADEVSRAHRSLMKKLHPDQGGSTYLAARVNEAKDVLTRRHR